MGKLFEIQGFCIIFSKKEKEMEMRILVVDGDIINLDNAVKYLRQLGHKVFHSVDLSGARKVIQIEKLNGVITDIFFQEKGINFCGKTSEKLRKEVIKASLQFCSALYRDVRCSFMYGRDSVPMEHIEPLQLNPALGYFVIRECMKKSIPVVFCIGAEHSIRAIPPVLATGIITTKEYNTLRSEDDFFCDRITSTSGGVFTPSKKTEECWEKVFEVLIERME